MSKIHVTATGTVHAKPEVVYGLLADYRHGHPQVLPQRYFRNLEVEEGGVGVGTIFHVMVHTGGVKRPYRMRVSEPEPGRVLMESDLAENSDLVTTFTVVPAQNEQEAEVTISSSWTAAQGVAGQFERILTPPMMLRIYRKELAQMDEVVRGRALQVGAAGKGARPHM